MDTIKTVVHYSDLEIIERILKGDIASFELLIRRYNPVLYKTGRSYGYNHQDVEDLMQNTFISAYENLAQFRHDASFKTWIVRIMLNHCYQKNRKFAFKNEIPGDDLIKEKSTSMFSNQKYTTPEELTFNRELSHIIEQAIAKIPVEYRLVFSLREINGFSVAETADALSISVPNVKVRLNRAKSMLRREIEQMYSAEEIFEFNAIYCDKMTSRVMNVLIK